MRKPGSERRTSDRVAFQMAVVVHGTDMLGRPAILTGQLQNVSVGGMGVRMPNDPFRGLSGSIRGRLRLDKMGIGSAVEHTFTVQWKREEPDGAVTFGIAFEKVWVGIITQLKEYDRIMMWF